MQSRYWINSFCPLLLEPGEKSKKVCDLPYGTIVERTGETQDHYFKVVYQAAKQFEGWIDIVNLETLYNMFPPGVVQIPPSDYVNWQRPAQYIVWNGKIQFNLCGEFCVSYIFGDDIATVKPGNRFLSIWQSKPTSFYNRVFSGGMARGTSASEVVDMVSMYGRKTRYIADTLKSGNRIRWSPALLGDWIEDHYAIIGVRIETQRGDLRRSGV